MLGTVAVQVVEESPTSAVFSIAMVVVYDECIISQASNGTLTCALRMLCSVCGTCIISPPVMSIRLSRWLYCYAMSNCSSILSGQMMSIMGKKVFLTDGLTRRSCQKPFATALSPTSSGSMGWTYTLLSMCRQSTAQVYRLTMPWDSAALINFALST